MSSRRPRWRRSRSPLQRQDRRQAASPRRQPSRRTRAQQRSLYMAATLVLSVSYGSTPTVSDGVTGIDLISADNATNSLANRQANPITVGTNSYEKWIRLKITATPANYVQSFKVWFNSTVDTSTTLYFTGAYVTYQLG